MKQIIIFPRGQLDTKDKERLSKAGIIAVEADDPSKVVACLPTSPLIDADDILVCAMKALNPGVYSSASVFLSEMTAKITAAHKNKREPS